MLTAYWQINDKLKKIKMTIHRRRKGERKTHRQAATFVETEKKVEK